MAELKTKAVSVLYNSDGTCEYICLSTHVSQREYNKLYLEMQENRQKRNTELQELKDTISELQNELKNCKHEIALLKGEDEDEEIE